CQPRRRHSQRSSFQIDGLGNRGLFAICQKTVSFARFFPTKQVIAVLLKELRLNNIDYPIPVRPWNMSLPISCLEYSMATRNPCFRRPLHEKSSQTTKSHGI